MLLTAALADYAFARYALADIAAAGAWSRVLHGQRARRPRPVRQRLGSGRRQPGPGVTGQRGGPAVDPLAQPPGVTGQAPRQVTGPCRAPVTEVARLSTHPVGAGTLAEVRGRYGFCRVRH